MEQTVSTTSINKDSFLTSLSLFALIWAFTHNSLTRQKKNECSKFLSNIRKNHPKHRKDLRKSLERELAKWEKSLREDLTSGSDTTALLQHFHRTPWQYPASQH